MFDIGFGEILVIFVVLLLVVGPERMPTVARTTALWLKKIRGLISQVKQEVEQELHAEELRQSLRKNIDLPDLKKPHQDSSDHTHHSIKKSSDDL
ncbi:Sec-independent protein translocase protein TatB [Candidatus Nitrosacidococcus tergens]|uniref:Sec-independent protein translocase protein TatB n=1 Tax=Candidatus Nitrosacidococcus tergens TaxID=553981 RepID=A0A7G1QC93_9GAMM|nr:Sec-independent protein translocase protein TatB [Candidatus Nitrosacidococcus tergens]CAB1277570.1 Sec-independent protein translocase protein TatB [Candidatus Nitrosacidococcus tergens]